MKQIYIPIIYLLLGHQFPIESPYSMLRTEVILLYTIVICDHNYITFSNCKLKCLQYIYPKAQTYAFILIFRQGL